MGYSHGTWRAGGSGGSGELLPEDDLTLKVPTSIRCPSCTWTVSHRGTCQTADTLRKCG